MDADFIRKYFEKATALALASAGVESVEKQALYLLAGEAERYARSLGANAARMAEAARRSECTVADVEAAALLLAGNDNLEESGNRINISSDMKKKLRLSVEMNSGIDTPVATDIKLPQLLPDSVENLMSIDEGQSSPSKATARRMAAYPEWLQREIEKKHQELLSKPADHNAVDRHVSQSAKGSQPLVSSLLLAEQEARQILTKKLKVEEPQTSPALR